MSNVSRHMRLGLFFRGGILARFGAGASLLSAWLPSYAAAPVYFDLGGLLLYVAVWLIATFSLGIASLSSKTKGVRYAFVGVLLLPVVVIAYAYLSREFRSARDRQEASRLFDAYAEFCKQRSTSVPPRPVPAAASASVLVRYATPDGQPKGMPYPDSVARVFFDNPTLCDNSSVREIQYVVPFANPVGKGTLNKTSVCPHRVQPQTVAEADAGFELVLGEKFEEVVTAHHGPWGNTKFFSFDVQLRDRSSNLVLVRETVSSAAPMFVGMEQKCPEAVSRIGSILRTGLPR